MSPSPLPSPVSTPSSRKKPLVIGLIVAGALLLIAAIVIPIVQVNRANQAASTYRSDVKDTVSQLLASNTPKRRVELVEKPPVLQPIWLGEQLSGKYRDAQALEARYKKITDDNISVFKFIYAFETLSGNEKDSFFPRLTATLQTEVPPFSYRVDTEAQKAGSKAYVDAANKQAQAYTALADEMKGYVLPDAAKEPQQRMYTALIAMANEKTAQATKQKDYTEKAEKGEIDENGMEKQATQKSYTDNLLDTLDAFSSQLYSLSTSVSGDISLDAYPEVRAATKALVEPFTRTDVQQWIVDTTQKTQNDYTAFSDSLK